MRQKSSPPETPSERLVRDIRRPTRRASGWRCWLRRLLVGHRASCTPSRAPPMKKIWQFFEGDLPLRGKFPIRFCQQATCQRTICRRPIKVHRPLKVADGGAERLYVGAIVAVRCGSFAVRPAEPPAPMQSGAGRTTETNGPIDDVCDACIDKRDLVWLQAILGRKCA